MLVGCHAGVNAAVLRHQVADLQGELPGVTVDKGSLDYKPLLHLLMLFMPVPVLPHYKHTHTQILLTRLKEHPPSNLVPKYHPSICQD